MAEAEIEEIDIESNIQVPEFNACIVVQDILPAAEIIVQKEVVSKYSPVIGDAFTSTDRFVIESHSRASVTWMLENMSMEFPEITEDLGPLFLDDLLNLAKHFGVELMVGRIRQLVHDTVRTDNAISLYEMAVRRKDFEIGKYAMQVIVLHTKYVVKKREIRSANETTIQAIANKPHLFITLTDLEWAIRRWAEWQLIMEGCNRITEEGIKNFSEKIKIPPKVFSEKYKCLVSADEPNPDDSKGLAPNYDPW